MDPDHQALVETFLAESKENLATMEQVLVALEAHPGDLELLHEVFRAAHTLKGNAAAFGLEGVTDLAHAVEDLLDRLRARKRRLDSALTTLLLGSVDVLREMLPAEMAGDHRRKPSHARLLKRLRRSAEMGAREDTRPPAVGERGSEAAPPRGPGRRHADIVGMDANARTLRVGIGKLDRLVNLSGELAIARGRLQQILEGSRSPEMKQALAAHREAERLHADLQELVMELRMVAVGPMFQTYLRTVRDQAGALGKQARLAVEGEDVEVDTKIIQHIHDPLTQMVRNALDHGIESPKEREKSGKDPCGTITLRARHETGSVVFEVSDDGSGLDRQRILDRAVQRGLISGQETLTDEQAWRLVLEPGFSTSEEVTGLSGRGVGLDVVRRHVDALRGTLSIDSRSGEGTTLSARVPLTLAIIPGFGVSAGGETYIVPMEAVMETLELRRGAPRNPDGSGAINLRGKALPYIRLQALFGGTEDTAGREQILVVHHDGIRAGLAVDELHGESQTVIKPLGSLFSGLSGIAGSAILGNGRVALILDVPALLREATRGRSVPFEPRPSAQAAEC